MKKLKLKSFEKVVALENLGICERCGAVVAITNIPSCAGPLIADLKNAPCPACRGTLTPKSFGYNGRSERIAWVESSGRLTKKKPKKDFRFGRCCIVVSQASATKTAA